MEMPKERMGYKNNIYHLDPVLKRTYSYMNNTQGIVNAANIVPRI